MKIVKEQNYIQMFAEYTRRYQEIILKMPRSVYMNDIVPDDDVETTIYMQLYFNLCSEIYYLLIKERGKICKLGVSNIIFA